MNPNGRAEVEGRPDNGVADELRPLLDRSLQRRVLLAAAEVYPLLFDINRLGGWTDKQALHANVIYLHEHGLIAAKWSILLDGNMNLNSLTITARGMDFLQDDGGLSAILGVVTVKLHDDTIRELLLAKVAQSDAPATVKARLADAIRSMPAEGLKATTMSLLQEGLDRLPDAVPLLQKWLAL